MLLLIFQSSNEELVIENRVSLIQTMKLIKVI